MIVKHPTKPRKERKSQEASYPALMRSLPLPRAAGGLESRSRVSSGLRCCRTAARGPAYGAAAASKMRDLAKPRVSKPERCRGSKPGVARGYTRGQSARAVLEVSDQASPRWRLTPWPSRKETVIIPGGEIGSFWGGGHPEALLLMQALLAETLLLQPQGHRRLQSTAQFALF